MTRAILATYRLQLRPGFGFAAAAELADYLAALGVSHLYASPSLQAAPGSTHGYDVVDPTRVSAELGGEGGHAALVAALAAHGLGQVLDIVPNHMALDGRANRWWWDVLENGPASRWAEFFDVDWEPPQAHLRHVVLLPILGDHFGRVLEAGEIRLGRSGGRFRVTYHEHEMPIAPRSLDGLLAAAARRCGSVELAYLGRSCAALPEPSGEGGEGGDPGRRHRDKEVLVALLARLLAEDAGAAAAVDAEVAAINGEPDRLEELLGRQSYRLAFWRLAGRELDYRRFFDVPTLIGLRVERPRVFAEVHGLVLEWVRSGVADGLRIDHPDGLHDPAGYCRRLRDAAPQAWLGVEKILMPDEELAADWPVDGTTGYEFLNLAGGLLIDPAGEGPLSGLWTALTGGGVDWPEMARAAKLEVLGDLLAADVNRLAELFLAVCEENRRQRDYSRYELVQALREVAAALAVYRTYVRAGAATPAAAALAPLPENTGLREIAAVDRARIEEAVAAAQARRGDLAADLLAWLGSILMLRVPGRTAAALAMRFQQVTAPAMAKGVEDTAMYRFGRLLALNEVGGDPGRFGVPPAAFHEHCRRVAAHHPRTLLATATHDTKRGEDVRARLALLSEMPQEWAAAVRRWWEHNARHRRGGGDLPDAATEYMLYQTLAGAWPLPFERAAAWLEKAAREARLHTSWSRPDAGYEGALRDFLAALDGDAEWQADLAAFVAPLIAPGRVNSLAQTLLKLTSPGVPDIYQGCELWDLSLVDPDNRRPVDYALRRRLLASLGPAGGAGGGEGAAHGTPGDPGRLGDLRNLGDLGDPDEPGVAKLWLTRQALHLRRRHPEWFGPAASYEPLPARGARAAHAVAFCRGGASVTVVPRLVLGLRSEWGDTEVDLPAAGADVWRNELTGESLPPGACRLADLLARFPVALLARQG